MHFVNPNHKGNFIMNQTKPFARWTAPIAVAIVFTSTSAFAFEPGSTECIAPAGAGGGWDMTCRLVGKTLQDLKLIPGTLQVINKPDSDNNLLVAASTATAARLGQNAYPGNTVDQVKWLASVGADYGMVAVAAGSTFNTLPELMGKVKSDSTAI